MLKDIPGYPGYKLDEANNVWSFKREKPIKLQILKSIPMVHLCVNGVTYKKSIRQLQRLLEKQL